MTAPHQDSRVEAALSEGIARLVDVVLDALPPLAAGLPLRGVAQSYRAQTIALVRAPLLDVLAALGVDTSAHVHAPVVDVHVHRPRCGWCGGALVASPTNETYTCADCRAVTPKFALPSMKG